MASTIRDSISAEREIILFDNTGVGLSGGEVPTTVADMARDAITFMDSLGLERVDILGFSLGARRLRRAGNRASAAVADPKVDIGGHRTSGWALNARIAERHGRCRSYGEYRSRRVALYFFAHTESSQAKGMEFLGRFSARKEDRGPLCTIEAVSKRYDAVVEWDTQGNFGRGRPRPWRLPEEARPFAGCN